ncbi:MAG: hypothetical protein IJ452_01600 [Butyricicoccus sp.]|nr:hypothetical protein [Butyricicoccus sp.]
MMEQDSIRLLRECDAGVKMGIDSIEETLDRVQDSKLRDLLQRSRKHHMELSKEIGALLDQSGDLGKDPSLMARGMSKMKTEWKLAMEPNDQTVAELITEGCDMGVRSLGRYLNEYAAAENEPRRLARQVIEAEEELRDGLKSFL